MWAHPSAFSNGSSALLKARSVEFIRPDGQTIETNVGKEVIAIGSPEVLELSGVGNLMKFITI